MTGASKWKHVPVFILMLVFCASTDTRWMITPPQSGRSLLVGGILVENNGLDDIYQAHRAKITVVIVGKSVVNGREKMEAYRIKTDDNGYFAVSNVPPGAYVLKGIEVNIGYANRMLIGSRWEGSSQIYYPVTNMISHTVRVWPEPGSGHIINMNIHYFLIDRTGRVGHREFRFLNNTPVGLKDIRHTMPSPEDYIRTKAEASDWFK